MRIVVVGGGAAGFFAACSAREHHPQAEVILLERTDKVLAKVRISGGGRCNLTHAQPDPKRLAAHYPRGERFLREAFRLWGQPDTLAWFAGRGVELKAEPDGRMFPVTDSSGTVIEALTTAARQSGVDLRYHSGVESLERVGDGWSLSLAGGKLQADVVIVTAGGHPKLSGYQWLQGTGHSIVPPVPSLFTFNLPDAPITRLMGVVAPDVEVRITGTRISARGPLLVTHWGFSGPAVLRTSAWGARELQAMGYLYTVRVDWTGLGSEAKVHAALDALRAAHPAKALAGIRPFGLPGRLWEFLLEKAGVPGARDLRSTGKHAQDKLVAVLTNDAYPARGKTTFKEEFVTAGGVDLAEVDPTTMASKRLPGLYFAGEVLDIDGITGGFNFQAAWTTGHIAGRCGQRLVPGMRQA